MEKVQSFPKNDVGTNGSIGKKEKKKLPKPQNLKINSKWFINLKHKTSRR